MELPLKTKRGVTLYPVRWHWHTLADDKWILEKDLLHPHFHSQAAGVCSQFQSPFCRGIRFCSVWTAPYQLPVFISE